MQIIVRISRPTAVVLHGHGPLTEPAREIVDTAEEQAAQLAPMHPGTRDVDLMRYFTATLLDGETVARAIAGLQACSAVEAAYVKPPAEIP